MNEAVYSFIMLAHCSVNNTAVEEDLGSIGDVVENFQRFPELVVIVVPKGSDPSLDLLEVYKQVKLQNEP